jgi:hypothetical protein
VSARTHGKRYLPALDVLEGRVVPSTALPANTLAVVQGTVSAPGEVAEVSVPITAANINGRIPIVIGTATSPTAGSGLNPRVVSARGAGGERLPVLGGAASVPARHNEATAFVQDSSPGTITLAVAGAGNTVGSFQVRVYLPGDINGDGQVTLADLQAFPKYFKARQGDALYNPAADANLNNQIGQEDARALVRNLKPLSPRGPLKIRLTLAPKDDVKGHVPSNSGGHTYHQTVTILGRTTPGSIVFSDSSFGDFSFSGTAIATDARGNFSVQAKNTDGINNNNFLVIDPYGQQKIMAYPIYYFPAVYQAH